MQNQDIYAEKALAQMPRILGNMDRNPLSATYGCLHRDYWLDKTSDFPDAVRQFAVQALALVYKHPFPGNPYQGHPKMLAWTLAALDFWQKIQHRDGSFDEFYPYERGWVGPTAFTTFTVIEALATLGREVPPELLERVRAAVARSARFICRGDREEDHLANHHAMACLAVYKAWRLLGDPELEAGYRRLWQGFLAYHQAGEGWSREYDGVDPGYLSATVSFLAKIYQDSRDPELLEVLEPAVECCSYFAYPNGYYGGSLGSRNTLHFYPHGFEILAPEIPLAGAVAEKMLAALGQGKLVPPEIISDRYLVYRVPEYLQAYRDYTPRPGELPPLPWEREPFHRYLPRAKVWVSQGEETYAIANLAKGGVVKVFALPQGRLLLNDCGILGRTSEGRVVTSQWIDPAYDIRATALGWEVSGHLHLVAAHKLFNPVKNIVFRLVLVSLGRLPGFSHFLKGRIRKSLILKQDQVPIAFRRSLALAGDRIRLRDEIVLENKVRLERLRLGDEFFARYVPQSMYFQLQELEARGRELSPRELEELNQRGRLVLEREIALT